MRPLTLLHLLALPLLPLAAPLLPLLLARARRARVAARRRVLGPRLAQSLAVLARAVVRAPPPGVTWGDAVRAADRWLASMPAEPRGRLLRQLCVLEWAPLTRGFAPLSRQGLLEAERFVDGPLAATVGFWGRLGRVRQLARLAVYATAAARAASGFVPPEQRRAAPRAAGLRDASPQAPEAVLVP